MSKKPQTKVFLFYIATLIIVLVLFRLTTAYGEARLQAPPNLNGRYVTAEPLPGCPQPSRLAITIQQSGIYLNGALELQPDEAADAPALQPEQLTLNGRWQQQVRLSGRTDALSACQPDLARTAVDLQGSLTQSPPALTGQLILNGGQPWSFTANRQATASKKNEH